MTTRPIAHSENQTAERAGFEPAVNFRPHSISSAAPSAARPPLRLSQSRMHRFLHTGRKAVGIKNASILTSSQAAVQGGSPAPPCQSVVLSPWKQRNAGRRALPTMKFIFDVSPPQE